MSLKSRVLSRLFTHEDPMNIHKTIGLFCLLSYFYHLGSFFASGKFYIHPVSVILHMALHFTSLIFKVLPKRGEKLLGMFIWEELRLHSAVFAFRACLILLLPDYRVGISLITMLAADWVTDTYGSREISTVRGHHARPKSLVKTIYSVFFSTSQLGASLYCFGFGVPNSQASLALVFATLPPIQTSAFGMTLLRKGLISKVTWQILYSLQLILGYIVWFKLYNNVDIIVYCLILYILRTLVPSKYVLWSGILVCQQLFHFVSS
jgi:hypothetical protein